MRLEHRVRAIHLNPSADLAERVLLPGDPHRALAVAQSLLEQPRMFNHRRGLWGYTGKAPDGQLLTVQSTGMGGPSAAIVAEELVALGARRLLRIGTCGALGEAPALGELLAAGEVIAADGASAALGADGRLRPDPGMTERLVRAGAREAVVVSTDLFYDPRDGMAAGWVELGAVVVEMEAAAILQVARRHRLPAACLLAVTDVPSRADGAERLPPEQVESLALRLGELGFEALAARSP